MVRAHAWDLDRSDPAKAWTFSENFEVYEGDALFEPLNIQHMLTPLRGKGRR